MSDYAMSDTDKSPSDIKPVTKSAKISIDTFSSVLRVVVGSGEQSQELFIPKGLILVESKFFQAACNERWTSGKTNTVTLDEDDPKLFSIFLTWLTTGSIKNAVEYKPAFYNNLDPRFDEENSQLFKLFVLGDTLQAPNFSNHVIDTLIECFREHKKMVTGGSLPIVSYIFTNTPEGSSLRKLIVDHFLATQDLGHKHLDSRQPGVAEFYQELAGRAMKAVRRNDGWNWRMTWDYSSRYPCTYHQHASGENWFEASRNEVSICRSELAKMRMGQFNNRSEQYVDIGEIVMS